MEFSGIILLHPAPGRLRWAVQWLLLAWLAAIDAGGPRVLADIDPKFYAVEVSAIIQTNPPQVELVWADDPNATNYKIYRKQLADHNWTLIGSAVPEADSFFDANVAVGGAYEYQVSKQTSVGYQGYGYVWAGINAPLVENRGTVILVVDETHAGELAGELSRLEQDLAGDGWEVIRHDVSPSDSVISVKQLIRADYLADPQSVRSVFLFGHVPVPYSGDLNPDGHPNHQGAWPADVYYGDMDGTWTDYSVNATAAEQVRNYNIPGDGKFDQSQLPSEVELEVGRVDLSHMTCFSNKTPSRSELDLLRQYLNKDHNYRQKLIDLPRRGLICDNFGEKSGEAFAASGWRNFAAFFGASNVVAVPGWQYFPTISQQGYLWSYGCGGGSYYTCDGIGSSDGFATNDIQSVFTMFLGSYFGDWDNESNFLRAPLGSSTYCLASMWAGRPHWFVHPMALGATIGACARLTQNNDFGGVYQPQNLGTRQVHVALMGDPTLRMFPVAPPQNLSLTAAGGVVTLNWSAPAETNLVGYSVYRGANPLGPFTRLNSAPLTGTSFTESLPDGAYTYMVRAIKLEASASGTYYNPSQGLFWTVSLQGGADVNAGNGSGSPALAPTGFGAAAASGNEIDLSWQDPSDDAWGFAIQRKSSAETNYTAIGTAGSSARQYQDQNLAPGVYTYRIQAFNGAGPSAYSNEASAQVPPAQPDAPAASNGQATFVQRDATTRGDWKGIYGVHGFSIMYDGDQIPPYAQANWASAAAYEWTDSTADPRALERGASPGRIASCWYGSDSLTLNLTLADGQSHDVALYFLDWDGSGRAETIDVQDAVTGATLDSQSISSFQNGVYLTWQVGGQVRFHITRQAGNNALVTGLFFGPPSRQLQSGGSGALTLSAGAGASIVHVKIQGQPGQSYRVDASPDLTNWQTVGQVTLVAPVGYLDDSSAVGQKRRFYRAVSVSP